MPFADPKRPELPGDEQLAALQREVHSLQEQVKTLIRTETKLHKSQNDLDHQLNIFSKLHELGLKITTGFKVAEIAQQVASFACYSLGYERALLLLDPTGEGNFRTAGSEGFYGQAWSEQLAALELAGTSPLATLTHSKKKLVSTPESPVAEVAPILASLGMEELIAYPMLRGGSELLGVLLCGNSKEQLSVCVRVSNEHSASGLANLSAQASAAVGAAISHQALEQERNLLDQKVRERTQELARALKELEELDVAKTQFFANVSHELRTPLTLSIAPLEEILKRGPGLSAEDRDRHLKVVYSNQLRLLKLINNLLDFAKIDAGQASGRFQELDLVGAIRFYLGTLSSAAEARRITLSVETDAEPVPLFLDRDKLEKIVMNLLSNAFKFTPDDGSIAVRVRAVGEQVEVDVADSGIGIPKEAIPKLFRRFMQVDSSEKRRYEGTGIGLAMVKEYVALHGGEIRVASEPGQGTTFTLQLKKGAEHLPQDRIEIGTSDELSLSAWQLADLRAEEDDAPEEDEPPVSSEAAASKPPEPLAAGAHPDGSAAILAPGGGGQLDTDGALVLVVDDIPDMRRFVQHILKERYRVRTARDGAEGLEVARRIRPDLIVSDVNMPRMTGFELCEAVKRDPTDFARTPVILLSAKGELSNKLAGLEHGADDYLVKPFNADELVVRARNLIRLRMQEKALNEAQRRALDAERRVLDADIALARRVQQSILPAATELEEGNLRLSGSLVSAAACSGDFWTWRRLNDGRVLTGIADVTGHGVGSAMLTELTYGALAAITRSGTRLTPAFVMNEMNSILAGSPIWMTMVIAIFEADGSRVDWCNAGHPPVFAAEPGQGPKPLQGGGQPLGAEATRAFEDRSLRIEPNTRFLMFSDGLVEATNAKGRPFGMRRLANAFKSPDLSPRSFLESIQRDLESFTGGLPLEDDVTAVAVTITPSACA